MNKFTLLLFALFINFLGLSQSAQTLRGKVVDNETHFPLIGATVRIYTSDSTLKIATVTDIEGDFVLTNVPVGKHQLEVKAMLYDNAMLTIEVISGKETILEIPVQEKFEQAEEVVITARKKGEVINDMAVISAQQFSVEESNRYAGSRSDPARMASNFAGVQGADDSRNDIVIRGNSPLGVLYKIEGIDIPNPNHFAVAGSAGGPVSIINNKFLGNSDFFMSAFPAQYGNSISGIFDLKLRSGNKNRHEFTGQFGFLGTEFLAEGPLSSKHNSSYLAMGRYSTLKLFQTLGISIGTDAVPAYGDFAFKMNWILKNRGTISFYALGGKSNIAIKISDQKTYSDELYGQGDRDQYFGTAMMSSGLNYKRSINEKTFVTATLAFSYEEQDSKHDYLIRTIDSNGVDITVDAIYQLMAYNYQTKKASGFYSINHKFNTRHVLRAGINVDHFWMSMHDSVLQSGHDELNHSTFINRWNFEGTALLIQPFVQWKWRMNEDMDFTAGLHAQYFSMSNSLSPAEPRLGWKYRMNKNQSIFAGAGLHSQMQPLYTYSYHLEGTTALHNKNMDFTKSIHTGVGYEKSLKHKMNFRTELYYQSLYNIPVEIASSSFSMINMGSGFNRFFPNPVQNTGIGTNYGVELTLQKYFDQSFFFMISSTIYQSTYKGSDGIERNTSYNGNHVSNFLAGKEFQINKKQSITIGTKITYAGGKRYGLVNVPASNIANDIVYLDSNYNDYRFKDYFRMDLKVNWKLNGKSSTHEIGLDLVNVFNTKNLLALAYAPNLKDPSAPPVAEKNQLGFLPLFYYKVDFKLKEKQ
jgi:hypothetical protein